MFWPFLQEKLAWEAYVAPVTLEHHVDPDEDWDNDVPVQGEPKLGSVVGLDFFWKFHRAIGNAFLSLEGILYGVLP